MGGKDFTVLIVDDDVEVLKLLKEIFELKKWRALTAPTGTSAVSTVIKDKIDLVLLDINLPDKPGLDVLREIKELYSWLPVIIITGLGYDDGPVNEAIRIGASGYVSKGVSVNELFEVVNNVMAG